MLLVPSNLKASLEPVPSHRALVSCKAVTSELGSRCPPVPGSQVALPSSAPCRSPAQVLLAGKPSSALRIAAGEGREGFLAKGRAWWFDVSKICGYRKKVRP